MRPLVSNPLSHILLAAIRNPSSLAPMACDALRETSGVLLEQLGVRLQSQSDDGSSAAAAETSERNE